MSDKSNTNYLKLLSAEEDYEYAHVRFKHQGPRKTIEKIDIVSTDWLSFNDNGSLQCKFLSSKYLEIPEKVVLLHDLLKARGPAPLDWPDFPVQPIGRAHTIQEALAKLEKLKTTPNVFKDCEDGQNEAEIALIKQVKRRILFEQQQALKRKINIDSSDEDHPTKKKGKPAAVTIVTYNTEQNYKSLISSDDHTRVHKSNSDKCSIVSGVDQMDSQTSSTSSTEMNASPNHSSGFNDGMNSTDDQNPSTSSTGRLLQDSEILTYPIVDLSTVVCRTEFETAVICSLNNFGERIGNMETTLKIVAKQMRDSTIESKPFSEKYNLDSPLKSEDSFEKFNKSLTSNESLKRDLYNEFRGCLDNELSITKTFGSILRKFISKAVLLGYTAVKSQNQETKQTNEALQNTASTSEDSVNEQSDDASKSFEPVQFCKCMYGKSISFEMKRS
ncbi:hypothetical protein QAD02_013463 [Eretmocerus hayati]|uniref:Uncharacterized protein n=1 Tax=Eretmocerus hayati TaxID=131215 RepID=A0ACC2P2M0_9HYME|nr:hypothetical protein QAD02_013463 [Eretmocerus hayati]